VQTGSYDITAFAICEHSYTFKHQVTSLDRKWESEKESSTEYARWWLILQAGQATDSKSDAEQPDVAGPWEENPARSSGGLNFTGFVRLDKAAADACPRIPRRVARRSATSAQIIFQIVNHDWSADDPISLTRFQANEIISHLDFHQARCVSLNVTKITGMSLVMSISGSAVKSVFNVEMCSCIHALIAEGRGSMDMESVLYCSRCVESR